VLALGDRLGPVRVVYEGPRDDGTLSFVEGSTPDGVRLAWDFRDDSWAGVDGVVRVNDPDAEPFRYLRLREPPYTDDDLQTVAAGVRDPAYLYVPNAYGAPRTTVIDQRTRKVVRVLHTGTLSQHVTPSWDLRTLYVTTARQMRDDDELARLPQSGGVFAMRVDVPGLPEPRSPL